MNEALTKNYEKIFKEQVAVIHAAFGEEPRTVAFVEVPKNVVVDQKLETAFRLTNSVNHAWWENEGVTPMFPDKEGCRSTSVGDMVLVGTEKYVCASTGWKKLNES